jgi:hypothetical protein
MPSKTPTSGAESTARTGIAANAASFCRRLGAWQRGRRNDPAEVMSRLQLAIDIAS